MATPPPPPNPYGPPGGNPYGPNPAPNNYAQPAQPPQQPQPPYGYPQQPPAPVPPPAPANIPPQPQYGYPQQPPGPAAPPPPGPPAPAFGYPNTDPYAGMQAPGGQLVCRFCGGYPAADVTMRRHQGMIVIMRFISLRGPFCKTCGTATFRDMQAKTLIQGWWGYLSGIINWITIFRNIGTLNKINALPEPMPGPGQPMIPGPPVTKRPVMFIFALPVLAFILMVAVLLASGGSSTTTSYPIDTSTSSPADPSALPSATSSPTDSGTGGTTGGDTGSGGLTGYQVGDCLTESGSGSSVSVESSDCTTSGAQKVLQRFDDTTDDSQCNDVSGDHDQLTDYDNSVVLCMGDKVP